MFYATLHVYWNFDCLGICRIPPFMFCWGKLFSNYFLLSPLRSLRGVECGPGQTVALTHYQVTLALSGPVISSETSADCTTLHYESQWSSYEEARSGVLILTELFVFSDHVTSLDKSGCLWIVYVFSVSVHWTLSRCVAASPDWAGLGVMLYWVSHNYYLLCYSRGRGRLDHCSTPKHSADLACPGSSLTGDSWTTISSLSPVAVYCKSSSIKSHV